MTVVFLDVETTGKAPANSGAFELAFLVYQGGRLVEEKLFRCNPLTETIKFSEEAYRVNGVSEETIKSYLPELSVVHDIAGFLDPYVDETAPNEERLVLAGYCCEFDYKFLKAMLERYGFAMDYFFSERMIDVHELVKRAFDKGLLPNTPNKKLETMTKALGIPHEDSHSAMSDIKATRRLYEYIYQLWRNNK